MKVRRTTLWGLGGLLLCLAGCAAPTVDYANALVELQAPVTGTPVALAVRDQRPLPLRDSALVGVARMTMGIPRDVTTTSEQPLGRDVLAALVSTLQDAGHEATGLPVVAGATRQDSLQSLRESGHDRWLLLEIAEWRSDGYFGELTVHYRLGLLVYVAGVLRSELGQEGQATEAYENRGAYAKACLRVFGRVFSDLLAGVDLSAGEPATPPTAPCTNCRTNLEAGWRVCPVCATPRAR